MFVTQSQEQIFILEKLRLEGKSDLADTDMILNSVSWQNRVHNKILRKTNKINGHLGLYVQMHKSQVKRNNYFSLIG